jgi:hypothetical protein
MIRYRKDYQMSFYVPFHVPSLVILNFRKKVTDFLKKNKNIFCHRYTEPGQLTLTRILYHTLHNIATLFS